MDKFCYFHRVYKKELKTEYSSINFEGYTFDVGKMEDYLSEYVLSRENLRFIFCENSNEISRFKLQNMLNRFLPSDNSVKNIDDISRKISEDSSYYSFLAEAILPLVYRDIYGFNLISSAIDINMTLTDTATGADACMYDSEKKTFVLGEAKFYRNFNQGMNAIITNFTGKDGFINKLNSLYRHSQNNEATNTLIIRELGKENATEFSFTDFLKLSLHFAGFVLHEVGTLTEEKLKDDALYDSFSLSTKAILTNIQRIQPLYANRNINISLLHFPIVSKKELIKKVIDNAIKSKGQLIHE